jgi:hypothetical protein
MDCTICDDQYDTACDGVLAELLRRVRVLDLDLSSEYTMRELISPVLIGALCLVDDHNKWENKSKMHLVCEKLISGVSGHGPVDYILSYLNVYIVIGEAKHMDLFDSLHKNLVQQCNALQSLADKILERTVVGVVGNKRSLDFFCTYAQLRNMSTFGITSTGTEWVFSRTEKYTTDSTKISSSRSQRYSLNVRDITTTTDIQRATLKSQIHDLLRLIVHIIFTQKAAVDDHPTLKNRKL